MADTLTKKHRSWNMSRIRSASTSPEVRVRKVLSERGYRYRLNCKKLPGKPDIVLGRFKTVILVNGCFWHQHQGCNRSSIPKTNVEYWGPKLFRNVKKQKRDIYLLKKEGWKVIKIWECETKSQRIIINRIRRVNGQVTNN